MAEIIRSESIDKLTDALGLQVSQGIPKQLGNQIIPVCEVNPFLLKTTNLMKVANSAVTGSTTLHTVKTGNIRTFATAINISFMYDAAADNVAVDVDFILVDGASASFRFPKLTLTATTKDVFITFPNPLELKKGSLVRVISNYTVGAGTRSATLIGYEEVQV